MKLTPFWFKAGGLQLHLSDPDLHDIERSLHGDAADKSADDACNEARLKALALQIHSARQLRAKYLPDTLFGETAWDIMLALYAFHDGAAGLDSLCESRRQSMKSTIRWIGHLEEQGLIARAERPDGPVVQLTDDGREALISYLAGLCGPSGPLHAGCGQTSL
jgi:hypothetical protein